MKESYEKERDELNKTSQEQLDALTESLTEKDQEIAFINEEAQKKFAERWGQFSSSRSCKVFRLNIFSACF